MIAIVVAGLGRPRGLRVMESARIRNQEDQTMNTTTKRAAAAALALATLAACGGGGGGPPPVEVPSGVRSATPSAGADVRADNVETLAPPLVRALLFGGSGDLLDPTGGGGAAPQAAGSGRDAGARRLLTTMGATLQAWLRHLPVSGRRQALAVSEETLACGVSGTLRVSFDDADNDQALSAGDSIGFFADACVDDPALPATSGGFTMRIHAVALDSAGDPVALDVSASFQDFGVAGYGTMNGAFRLWARQETAASTRLRLSFLATTVADPAGAVTYDFDVDALANAQSGSFEIGGGLVLGGQTYALSSPARIGFPVGLPPSTGELRLADAAGDTLRVVPRSAHTFDLQFWPAGATAPLVTLPDRRWDDYTD
jgi:hypothetical protein